ncbi:MAG TPA: 50S ribosomal protein L33 [Dehalococcoidales bacterium]|nr:50S ribosomal protein L33 [Dehalococcoidales bacterium]
MAKSENRVLITLACTECKERTYTTFKNKRNDSQRMELKKYCPSCRKQQLHREVR